MRRIVRNCSLLLGFFAFCLPVMADLDALSGEYQCAKIEVEGRVLRCASPPLILNSDGSYQIWGESGSYHVVEDRWLVLSHSKRRGTGYFQSPKELVFEYQVKGRSHRVTFRRVFEPTPGLSDT
jgi:hypothetical protein